MYLNARIINVGLMLYVMVFLMSNKSITKKKTHMNISKKLTFSDYQMLNLMQKLINARSNKNEFL